MVRSNHEELRVTADRWREAEQCGDSGFVLIYEGKPFGWKISLSCSCGEVAGVYAVSCDGSIFISIGDQPSKDGQLAVEWSQIA